MEIIIGLLIIAVGAFCQSSSYVPINRIKEWRNEIEEIDQLIQDNKEAAVDAIFGEDVSSAIEDFAESYAEAWASSEDKAESAKDTVISSATS